VQHFIEGADGIGIDVVEQEDSCSELCSRQAQNAFGRQVGVAHGDKNHVFKTGGFNLQSAGGYAGEQWPQLLGQIEPTQIALQGFRLVLFRRPQGSVFGPEPGKRIIGREVLELPPMSALQKTWKNRLRG